MTYTALNQAITEKADASALANEVSRATGAENDLRTAIDTKADATALSNYVLTTALNQQIDTLNAAISDKQDAGNYVPYTQQSGGGYEMEIGFENPFGDIWTNLEGIVIREMQPKLIAMFIQQQMY